MLNGKNIVIGVSGGIAVYKVADVVSRLKKLGANVYVIMTKHATEFVAPLTFQSLSQNYVVTDMFEDPKTWDVEHIALAKRADLFLIAPATANVVGKMAHGIADDMLTTTVMATTAPVFVALAMNTNMYNNPIVQNNVSILRGYGYEIIEPESGRLACGDIGAGKLASPEGIVAAVEAYFNTSKPLAGKKVLVTAGPTREPIDPVRYISNRSSGKMGYAIAEVAAEQGAEVVLVSGPTALEAPKGVQKVSVETTGEMFDAVMTYADYDVIIKAAAPSDYGPEVFVEEKIKKSGDVMTMTLSKRQDILLALGAQKKATQVLVGFAAETNDLQAYAIDKLNRKNLDFIVANNVAEAGAGFDKDTNCVTLIDREGQVETLPLMQKKEVAKAILNKVTTYIKE